MPLFSRFLLGLSLVVADGRADAADQGDIGASSRGSVTITVSVASRSVASGVSDIAASDTAASQSVCLWSNGATRGFGLAATGDGPGGALVAADGSGDAIPYDVQWDGAPLTTGSPRTGLTATATRPGCDPSKSDRGNLNVSFPGKSVHHKGTLTLLVIPQ